MSLNSRQLRSFLSEDFASAGAISPATRAQASAFIAKNRITVITPLDFSASSLAPGCLRRSLTVMIAANPGIAAAIITRQSGIEAPPPRPGDEEEQEDETIED